MIIETPWKHEIIDDFLAQDDFEFLCNLELPVPENDNWTISKNQIYKNGKTNCIFPKKITKRFQKRYFERLIDILYTHAPEKIKDVDYMEFNIVQTGKDFIFGVHPDSKSKLLSVVIYLTPEENTGTILYDNEKGNPVSTVPWKQNRCLVFSRTDNTWHDYKSDGKNIRRTLVLNLRN